MTTPSGFVVMRRIVEANGSFTPVTAYTTIERDHVWRREAGESADAFETRVIDEAEWIAVRRGRKVTLIPLE